MAVSLKIKGGNDWKKALEGYNVSGDVLKVGVLEGATYPDGTPVATVAAAQEYGTEHIPARSFMRSTLAEKEKDWVKGVAGYLKANPGKVREAITVLGELASKDIQEKIESNIAPALALETVARKAKAGKANPELALSETGVLQESISYEVLI